MLQVFSFAWEYKFSVILPVAEVPTSGDLKSGNFFRTSTPSPRPNSPMRPPRKFLIYFYPLPPTPYPLPPPPISPSNFAGKTWISLSGSSIGWILIQSDSRLYRSITKKKVASFCLQRTTAVHAEHKRRLLSLYSRKRSESIDQVSNDQIRQVSFLSYRSSPWLQSGWSDWNFPWHRYTTVHKETKIRWPIKQTAPEIASLQHTFLRKSKYNCEERTVRSKWTRNLKAILNWHEWHFHYAQDKMTTYNCSLELSGPYLKR